MVIFLKFLVKPLHKVNNFLVIQVLGISDEKVFKKNLELFSKEIKTQIFQKEDSIEIDQEK